MKIAILLLSLVLQQTIDESHGRKYKPGDVITITAETNKVINLYSSGTPEQPITLNANGVILKDTYINFQSGANYWIINGLTMNGGPRLVDAYKCNGLTLRNCVFGPIADNGSYCVRISTSNNIVIDKCNFVTFSSIWRSPVGTNNDGLVLDNCNDNIVSNNYFGDCGHVALNVRNSARNLITGNKVENHLHTGVSILNIPGNPGNSIDNIVEYNKVKFFNKNPSDLNLPGVGIEVLYASGNKIRYNEISDGKSTGITIAADAAKGWAKSNVISYNTLYKTGERGIEMGMFGVISSDTVVKNVITKNIITGTWAEGVRGASIVLIFKDWSASQNDLSSNFMTPPTIKLREAIGDITLDISKLQILTGDPKFVWSGRDFHLRSGSPAIGFGAYP